MACVFYKFYKYRNKITYGKLNVPGSFISLSELKQQVRDRENVKHLNIINAQTHEEYTEEGALIPPNSYIIIRQAERGEDRTRGSYCASLKSRHSDAHYGVRGHTPTKDSWTDSSSKTHSRSHVHFTTTFGPYSRKEETQTQRRENTPECRPQLQEDPTQDHKDKRFKPSSESSSITCRPSVKSKIVRVVKGDAAASQQRDPPLTKRFLLKRKTKTAHSPSVALTTAGNQAAVATSVESKSSPAANCGLNPKVPDGAQGSNSCSSFRSCSSPKSRTSHQCSKSAEREALLQVMNSMGLVDELDEALFVPDYSDFSDSDN